MSGPPDFVGVGVQGAGVAWWSRMLADHPQIEFSDPRARNHFEAFCAQPMTDEDVAAYHAGFDPRPGVVTGEWSLRYAYDFWTAPLLARAAPEAKLLVLLRDPVQRMRAGLAHQNKAIARRKEHLSHADAIFRGRYGEQLRLLLEHFPRERLLVLQYERVLGDPAGEYARTCAHLGVDPAHRPSGLEGGPSDEDLTFDPWPDLVEGIRGAFADDLEELMGIAPELDLSLWPDLAGAR